MEESVVLHDLLMTETSRRNTDMVAEIIYGRPELFDDLVRIYLENREPVSRRAAWVVDTVSERFPELILPHLEQIILMLPHFAHDGLKRHSLRMIERSPIPGEPCAGILIKTCFDWLLSPAEATAVKVWCMEILYRISHTEPDIRHELADTIEWRLSEETAGFRNKGMKILKKLSSPDKGQATLPGHAL